MADRVVKVALKADISDYTAGLVKAAAQTRGLAGDVEKSFDRDLPPKLSRSGEKSGGLFAQGFRTGFVRNSPLIAAGIGAALAAGAPVALAGAGVLFGGIGALAAAQTQRVRTAWTDLGHDIRDGAIEDASVLVPVYEEMADKIGAAFQRMRPEIRDAFTAAAPQIDAFTDSLTQAAENALPGLVRAVERGGPVIEGLGSLMESIGTGISDFFDAMSDDNAQAAGEAFEAIGDALGEALPLLGELLGTGAEIASIVLPPFAVGLGLVRDVAKALGPLLPPIAVGFAAFKVAKGISGLLDGLASSMDRVAQTGGRMQAGVDNASGALGPLAIVLAGYTIASQQAAKAEDEFRANAEDAFLALRQGGPGLDEARARVALLREAADHFENSPLQGFFNRIGLGADLQSELEAAEEGVAAMGTAAEYAAPPLENVRTRLEDLSTAADDARQSTDLYKLSLDILSGDTVSLIEVQSALETALARATGATEGLTGSVLDSTGHLNLQSEAGRAAADVLLGVRDSGNQLIATMIEQGATTEEVLAADANLRESFIRSAEQMGISREAAEALADQILDIPSERETEITADTTQASNAVTDFQRQVDNLHGTTVQIQANWANGGSLNGSMRFDFADGGIVKFFANGGHERHVAQMAPAGAMRLWAEPETGGESYIPHSPAKRKQSIKIWQETGRILNAYADGGVTGSINVRADFNPVAEFARNAAGEVRKLLEPATGMVGALNWARTQVGKPYVWGSAGPYGYDCSGFMAALTNVIRGDSPYARLGSTATMPWSGFSAGSTGNFVIGNSRNTGGGIGHMAGTLLGVNVESAGGVGVRVGGSARGSGSALFGEHYAFKYDQGGPLYPGLTLAYNGTGQTEWVSRESSGGGSAPVINVAAPNLNGMRITGTVAFDPSGMLRFVDARVDGAMGEVADKQLYGGG